MDKINQLPAIIARQLQTFMLSECGLEPKKHYVAKMRWNDLNKKWEINIELIGRYFRKASIVKEKLSNQMKNATITVT